MGLTRPRLAPGRGGALLGGVGTGPMCRVGGERGRPADVSTAREEKSDTAVRAVLSRPSARRRHRAQHVGRGGKGERAAARERRRRRKRGALGLGMGSAQSAGEEVGAGAGRDGRGGGDGWQRERRA